MKNSVFRTIAVSLLVMASMSAAAQEIDLTDFTLSRHDFVDTVKVEIVNGAVIVPVEIEGETKRMLFDTGAEFGFWIAGDEAWMKPSGDYLVTANGIPITDLCTYVTLSYKEKVTNLVLRTPDGIEKEIEW